MRRVIVVFIVIIALAASAAGFAQADPQALQRMVATERAFAAATAELGVRDGFLSFFADDAIQIRRDGEPALIAARAALASQPLQKLPIANRLLWEPFTGQMSSDGTLGWLTGGFVSMNQAQKTVVAQGAYFSVWTRQPDGTYRVWLDEGISLPQIWQGAAPFRAAPDPDPGAAGTPGETLEAAEAAVSRGGEAWRARLSAAVRLHVDGRMPAVGRDAVLSSPRAGATTAYRLMRTEQAASGDLAVAIGTFESATGTEKPRGSWVRVWKRDVAGHWRIVFQTENGG
jgi:hypothetical protein